MLMKRVPLRDTLWLFLVTRLLLILVTYFGYILLTAEQYSSAPVDTTAFFSSWQRWDAVRYLRIAQYGYQTTPDFAFFPLFPLLIRAFAFMVGDWSYLAVGTILSNLALLGSLFVLYPLAADLGGDRVGRRSLLYLCIFPTAFFFFTAYNESLFLFLTCGVFLALQRQRWWLAGILGCCAALTRNAGILLIFPYLYELWDARERLRVSWLALLSGLLPIILIPAGTLLYSVYCWQATGDPFVYANVQSSWARHLSWPWQGIWQALFEFFWNQPFGSFFQVHVLLGLSATLGFIVLTIVGWKKLRFSYSLWNALLLFYFLLSPSIEQHDPLISLQRFVLELFPAFITLGFLSIERPRIHLALQIVFISLQATLSLLFVMNRWMV
jgi:Gpi18-like mannosyltransferase